MKVAICLFLLLLSALANAISSASSKHLEPVLNANLKFKPETAEVQRRREEQNRQPFPSSLVLTFDAYETSFFFDLEVFSEITQGASMTFYGENDAWVEEVPFQHKVYRGNKFNELGEKIGWINLVAHDDGLFEALIFEDGELYSVTPISVHRDELDAKSKRDLEAQSELVITKESDASESHKLCGVASPDQYTNPLKKAEREASSSLESGLLTTYHPQEQINRNLLTVERWTDCFPNPNGATKRFDVFFYVDQGFYLAAGGTQPKVQDTILSIISQSNVIYLTQLNVFLFPGTVRVQTAPNGDLFNQVRGSCSTIDVTLTRFSAWRSTQDNENDGTYHLLTDCYPPPGVVGLAWLGVLCAKNAGTSNGAVVSGTGVSTMSATTWKTVAHELGHNFGAAHSFQEGQGTTGGIMDYGDGKLNGEFQFNSKYNKAEVCKEVASSMVLTGSTIVKNCWKDLAPKCGNGVVEPGEECDDNSACCVSKTCKFIAGGQCSSGPCCNNCQFAPTTTTCGNESYCVNGLCTPSLCASYSDLTFCGNRPNSCYEACILDGTTTCTPIDQFKTSTGAGLNGMVPDGAVCNTAPYSVCQTGTCKASTFSWRVNNGTCNPKTCVSNATVVCLANNEIVVDDTLCTRNNAGDKPVIQPCCVKSGQLGVAVGAGVGGAVVLLVVAILVFLYVRFQRAGVNQKTVEVNSVPRNIY